MCLVCSACNWCLSREDFFYLVLLCLQQQHRQTVVLFFLLLPLVYLLYVCGRKKAVAWAAEKNIAASIEPGQWGIVSA